MADDGEDVAIDAALVSAARVGVAEAEHALYNRHVDRLFAMAFQFTGDHDAAADLVQETFIVAFEKLGQFRGEARFITWLGRILVSRVLSERRRPTLNAVALDDVNDLSQTTPPNVDAFDTRSLVAAAVRRLTPKLRAVVILFDIQGYTHEEVGLMLGIPVGTSKARLSEARSQLRALLASLHIA